MIEYRNIPDRAQLAWRLRRANRNRGRLNPETEGDWKPAPIETAEKTTSPDDQTERNENEPDE